MRLNGLDYLSSAPQTFIFQRRSNKSNFGGALSLINLTIFAIITIFYLFSYLNEDNYAIQYLYQEKTLTGEETSERYNNERFNPYFNFCVSTTVEAEKEISERFGIRRYNGLIFFSEVEKSKCYQMKASDLNWVIVYDCFNETDDECHIDPNKFRSTSMNLNIYFNGFVIDHQNKTAPLYRLNGDLVSHWFKPVFDIFNPSRQVHTWNTIRYKEQKGFFSFLKKDEDNDYIGLGMKSYDYSEMSGLKGDKKIFVRAYDAKSKSTHNYKVIGRLKFEIDFYHYDEYKRIPKSFLDMLANICSLNMSILNGLSYFLMNYFSNNYNNYKIMEKILNGSNNIDEKEEKKNKEINEAINDLNKEENLIDEKKVEQDVLGINDENGNDDDKIIINKDFDLDNKEFPNFNLFDFLFNFVYDGKCCKKKTKKLIEKCNEIIAKYNSLESIIFNQIKIESLLKDYRWNDPGLNNFDNNDLIIQLKNIISSFNNS